MLLSQRDHSAYLSEDTIAAVATAFGGPTAMIRVSGPACSGVLARITDSPVDRFSERKLVRASLFTRESTQIDDALVARFKCPDSFTGEDVLEFHVHGSPFVAETLLQTLIQYGVRQALPGEFSFRAVRNGKFDITQAQATAELIAASNSEAVSLALEKMSGTQNRLFSSLAEELRKLASLAELGIDFADQDVDEVSLPTLKRSLGGIRSTLQKLYDSFDRGSRIQDGLKATFVGLPNAGKSSFFNALLGEDRSIVSEIPGTTRDVVHERLTLRGERASITLRLEDTAGLRESADRIETFGVERTRKSASAADLVLLVVDVQSDLEETFKEWRALGSPQQKTLGILSKVDLVSAAHVAKMKANLAPLGLSCWVETSSNTGLGISAAVEEIVRFCSRWTKRAQNEVLLTRLDHQQAVASALEHLDRARLAEDSALFAADLRQGLVALAPVIGTTLPDDLLAQIFSEFCIGK
jgi:tRNA modification GTPase